MAPSLYRKLGYDPRKSFAPVSLVSTGPLLIAVNTAVPAQNLAQLESAIVLTDNSLAKFSSTDLDTLIAQLSPLARTLCLTRGPQGCIVVQGERRTEVPAVPTQAVDTNGAGDMFAGTFLYAITHGHTPAQAAALANRTAAAVVSQHGNRLTAAQMQAIYTDFQKS